jgi:hypothetical protein
MKSQLAKEYDNTSPSPNGGTLAFNDTIYLVSGPQGEPFVYAYQLMENTTYPFYSRVSQLWNISTSSLVVASMKTAFHDTLTYYIESNGGYVVCVDTLTGIEQWRYGTAHDVVADFTIIHDEYLLLDTTNGYTILIQIGSLSSSKYDSTSAPSSQAMQTTKMSDNDELSPSTAPSRAVSLIPSHFSFEPSSSGTNFPTIDTALPSSTMGNQDDTTPSVDTYGATATSTQSASTSCHIAIFTDAIFMLVGVIMLIQ